MPEAVSLGYLSNSLLLISGFMGCFKAIVNSAESFSDNSAPSSWKSSSLSLVLSLLQDSPFLHKEVWIHYILPVLFASRFTKGSTR